MRYLNFILLLAILCMTLLGSCEYQLKSESFRDITRPDTTRLIYIELSKDVSSYKFTVASDVHYNLNTFGLNVYNVVFFLGETQIYHGSAAEGTFVIDPASYAPGEANLTMIVTTGTSTGSLADIIGREGMVYSTSWKIIMDGQPPNTVAITRIYNDSGLLKLEWEKYTRENFQEYKIWLCTTNCESPYDGYMVKEIFDQNQNSWYDSSYVGGKIKYWIEVVASYQNSASEKMSIDYPLPVFDTLWQRGDSALFHWSKNPFYRAIYKYVIYVQNSRSAAFPELVYNTSNPDDTTFLMRKMMFGMALDYTLYQAAGKPMAPRFDINSVSSTLSLYAGKPIPKSSSAFILYDSPILYLGYYGAITKCKLTDRSLSLRFQDDFSGRWFVTPDDRYIFTYTGNTLTKRDPQTFTEISTMTFGSPGVPIPPSISLNGLATVWLEDGIGLYDFINDRYIFSGKNKDLRGAIISPDGKFAVTPQYPDGINIISQVTDTGLVVKWSIPQGYNETVYWINDGYSKLFITEGMRGDLTPLTENEIKIYDPETQSLLTHFSTNPGYIGGADPASGKVAVYDNNPSTGERNKVYIYNYRTSAKLSEIRLAPLIDYFFMYKSYLISGEGYCMDISGY